MAKRTENTSSDADASQPPDRRDSSHSEDATEGSNPSGDSGYTKAQGDRGNHRGMTPERALRLAWIWWLTLLLIPFVVFIAIVWLHIAGAVPPERPTLGMVFFGAALIWLLVMVPATFTLRNYVFREYWQGRPVEPGSYLRGMLTIWLAPEIGGLIALAGVLVSGQWMPCLLPAAAAFVLFTPFWPTGRAMFDPVGDKEDEEFFRYPR